MILYQRARHGFGWQIGRLYGWVFHVRGLRFSFSVGLEDDE